MANYDILRRELVETSIVGRGIKDEKVIEAMLNVPREEFVPDDMKTRAYEDKPLPIGKGQTISQPYMVALMTELLELKGDEKVLEIGTGSGYQAAIIAYILKKGRLYTIEYDCELLEQARERFKRLGFNNIVSKCDDGFYGWNEYSPFDRIIVTCGTPRVPEPLISQLKIGGILVAPVGNSIWGQELVRLIKISENEVKKEHHGGCIFVPMRGAVND